MVAPFRPHPSGALSSLSIFPGLRSPRATRDKLTPGFPRSLLRSGEAQNGSNSSLLAAPIQPTSNEAAGISMVSPVTWPATQATLACP